MPSFSNLEVDAIVKAPPDEEALDEAAAGQTVFVQINSVQTAVSLVMNPLLVFVHITCTGGRENVNVSVDFSTASFPLSLTKLLECNLR